MTVAGGDCSGLAGGGGSGLGMTAYFATTTRDTEARFDRRPAASLDILRVIPRALAWHAS